MHTTIDTAAQVRRTEVTRLEVLAALHTTASVAAMRTDGWTRVDGGKRKGSARWEHRAGWRLEHCGHPTATTPWALFAPDGRMHCIGRCHGEAPQPRLWHGVAEPRERCGVRAGRAVSARKDAARIAALVEAVDELAAGKNQQLGELAARVFDWTPERVFLAIHYATTRNLIARNEDSGAISAARDGGQ